MNIQEVNAMTVQQAVEYSLDKIVKQGERCMRGDDCTYGDGEGNHCAIGWLLDTNNADLMGAEGSVSDIARCCGVPELIKDNVKVFNTFQCFHDAMHAQHREEYKVQLRENGVDTSHTNFQAWVDLGK